jgi:hypothetical protein
VSTTDPKSPFWPLTLVSLSVAAILGYQLLVGLEQQQLLARQKEEMTQAVVQSQKIQRELEKLASDLLTLSTKDADAKALIDKYKIARGSAPGINLTQ